MTDLSELKSNLFPVDSDANEAAQAEKSDPGRGEETEQPLDIDQALKNAGLPDAEVPT